MGMTILNATDFMLAGWATPFLVRNHGMDLGAAGSLYGIALALGGIPGTLIGGYLLDRLALRDLRWHCWLCVGAMLVSQSILIFTYISPSPLVAGISMTTAIFIISLSYAANTALPFGLVKSRMGGVVYAVYSIGLYLGWGLGPLFAGFLSTQLEPAYGTESLRIALIFATILFAIWSAAHFWAAAKTYSEDCRRAAET